MTTASVTSEVRVMLNDEGEAFLAQFVSDGVSTRFELPQENIEPTNPVPLVTVSPGPGSAVPLNPNSYTFDTRFGILTLANAVQQGETIFVSGVYYREFEPADITNYINLTLAMWNKNRVPPVFLDPQPQPPYPPALLLPAEEERVFVKAVALEALWDLATEASQDIDITTPDGVQIARGEYYRQIMGHIQALQAEYERQAKMLNVGLERIETFNLRRVSRTTNRLVPEYVDREFDNRLYPQRILPNIDPSVTVGSVVTQKGEWSATTAYVVNDFVDWRGTPYICTTANTGIQPDTDVAPPTGDGTNGPHWSVSNLNYSYFQGV